MRQQIIHNTNFTTIFSEDLTQYTDIFQTGGNATFTAPTIRRYREYTPFGLDIQQTANSPYNTTGSYRYGFNGKESDEEGEWGSSTVYDYGFRVYNPAIARWLSVDPLAQEFAGWSGYNYVLGNPVILIDPDGRIPYPITVRSFAPFNRFGGGFHGDGANRGFTTSSEATARIHQVINFDTDKPYVTSNAWSSPTSHGLLGEDTSVPTSNHSGFESRSSSRGEVFEFSTEVWASNPLMPGSPDIDVKSKFKITEESDALVVVGEINGDNFPSTEAFITDPSGQSVFLGVGFYKGNPYTSLPGNNNRPITSFSVRIRTDGEGNFTGVNINGKNISLEEWNDSFTDKNPHLNHED